MLAAARVLVAERGAFDLTFDEIAERAEVSRRTIFNHFPTREDLVIALCEDVVVDVIEAMTLELQAAPTGAYTVPDYFAALTSSLTAIDLPAVIERIAKLIDPDDRPARRTALLTTAFSTVGTLIHDETRRRLPTLGELQVDLLASAFINGICVIAETWHSDPGADPDRSKWSAMLSTLMSSLERGYAHTA
ncbi:hypothetical protein GCM10010401_17590 [Rarobacter faecitabidus]|uniref:TetR family transcriptional regulator n=1 Tax=Rarobacter faecitabidus TaxID=13243 RepID=A0A542ZUV1_RARFA|nr:TetR family transcriptional regulator [Rarobacter faecitabidus]